MEFKDQKITDINMEREVKTSFLQYAMSVITARALPDVRDGLKPVHRRILYSMYEDGLTYNNPYSKSATTVGNVLGRYHPHGDAAVYDALVRMAQTFSMRYPLIDGQGNFGTVDGDAAAAYRYTEARLSRIASEMMSDIKKDVVDFTPNFDNKLKEPTVLPSRFPNLLVNGSIGIAVGMATNIPPHNICEVIDGTIHLIDNPDATIRDLMEFIKGPDFPTAAMICGTSGIIRAYTTGRGHITVRARADVDEDECRIVITEIPYQVNKKTLVEAIADCVKNKRVEGITDLRDESDLDGMRIVIEYRRDANGHVILNQLYKFTQLQDTFAVNMLALVDGVPRTLNLKQLLEYYIAHQIDVITRRTEYDLARAQHEEHIYEGFKLAIDNIDRVISIIRSSRSIAEAKASLIDEFSLSDAQAQAIVDMTLGRLVGLERIKIEEHLAELRELVADLQAILADPARVRQIIKDDLNEIKRRYGDERRTELVPFEDEIVLEDLIERHICVITLTRDGYIKRLPSDTYTTQRRGGKGIVGMTTKEEDSVENVIAVHSHSYLMLFTNIGKVFVKKAYEIPEASRTAKGTNIVNILELTEGEAVTSMISVKDFAPDRYLTMVTRLGEIKRTPLVEYEYNRKAGKKALDLEEGDELVFTKVAGDDDEIIVATRGGYSVRFALSDVTPRSRTAGGVRAVRLTDGDVVAGATIVDDTRKLLTITSNGYGKLSEFSDYPRQNRGGKGVRCHGVNEKTGEVVGIATVDLDDDIMIITDDGTVIRTGVREIPVYGRTAGGVIVMRPSEGSEISNFTVIKAELEQPEEPELPAKSADMDERGSFDDGVDEGESEENGDDLDI
ncbi:MAG: DNA gyrase subunit A [Eubacteriales bacterium]